MNTKKTCFARKIDSLFRRWGTLAVLASVLVLIPMIAFGAATVDLAWDANTEPDLAGYKIYYGTASGNYTKSVDVGNTTQYTLAGLNEGVTYYLAATAYDVDDNESAYSVELVHTTASPNHNPANPSVPNGPSNGYTQTTYSFSTTATDPDGDSLQFQYDWDDASISGWGAVSQSHSWSSAGNFCVKTQAKDSHGALSGWSGCKSVTITENTHTIAASAGANGSISPSGSVTVNHGSSRTFTISAGTNYHVQDVLVDGISVGADTTYTFTNVTQNHTIQASFAINTHTIAATAGANGSISPSGNVTVNYGSNRTFTISPNANYHVQNVLVNGVSVGAVTSYTFTNVTQNHTIQASFAIDNQPPMADAGADQAVYVNHTVRLDGSGSSDVDGNSLTFTWSFVSKPSGSNATLSDTKAVKPIFDVDAAGTYTVQLIVNDGTVNSAPDTVTISTDNSAPVGHAGADQAVLVNDTVQLDGSGSSDVDGTA